MQNQNENVLMSISVFVLLMFVGMFSYVLYVSWQDAPLPEFVASEKFVFAANSLAATVGALVATSLGQTLPTPPHAPTPNGAAPAPVVPPVQVAAVVAEGVKVRASKSWRDNVPAMYTLSYFALGMAAIVTWLIRTPPEMVNTLGYITFGLMLNVARVVTFPPARAAD